MERVCDSIGGEKLVGMYRGTWVSMVQKLKGNRTVREERLALAMHVGMHRRKKVSLTSALRRQTNQLGCMSLA